MQSKLSVVSSNGLHMFSIDENNYKSFLTDSSSIFETAYDPSGRYFSYCSNNGVYLIDLETEENQKLTESGRFRKIMFSPLGNYVCYFGIKLNGDSEMNEDNVVCFKTVDGSLQFSYKYGMTGMWYTLWSPDEKLSIRLQKSEIVVYEDDNFDKYVSKLTLKGIDKASITQSDKRFLIAVYIKAVKTMPHMMKIYEYPNFTTPINNRSFFKSDDIALMSWHPCGKGLLFMTHSDSGKTYYGENALYYMSCDVGNSETALISTPSKDSQDSSIHSAQWQTGRNSHNFIVMHDNPMRIAIYNDKCQFLSELDAPGRNLCHFSSCGDLLAAIGSGSVHGSLQLWNFNTKTKFGEMDLHDINRLCWSGNDKYLITSTVSPSLRVNNGFILWNLSDNPDNSTHVVIDKPTSLQLLGNPNEVYSVTMQLNSNSSSHSHCTNHSGFYYYDSNCRRYKEKFIPKSSSTYVPPHLRNKPNNANTNTTGDSSVRSSVKLKNGQAVKVIQDNSNNCNINKSNNGAGPMGGFGNAGVSGTGGKKKRNRNKNKNNNSSVAK